MVRGHKSCALQAALAEGRHQPLLDAMVKWGSKTLELNEHLIHQMVHDNSNAIVRFTGLDESISNRIVAGLSLGTLVVEAQARSGALITARLAADAGREVFAIPGSIHEPKVRGCHRLIRDGAGLVESAGEVIAALAPQATLLAQDLQSRLERPHPIPGQGVSDGLHCGSVAGDADYQTLWNALGYDPTAMDQLV